MISKDQIQEVRDRTDILSLIESYITVKKTGRTYKACCPFHNEKTPSFHVNPDHQNYHCFGCGEHGSAFDFVMKMEGLDFPSAVRQLANRAGIMLIESGTPEEIAKAKEVKKGKERIHELLDRLTQWYISQLYTREGKIATDYLLQRGIEEKTARRFSIGYSPDSWDATKNWAFSHGYTAKDLIDAGLLIVPEGKTEEKGYDRFRGRLMFPIWSDNGQVVGYSARTLKNENAKYINSPDSLVFNKSKILYAFPLAKPGFREHNHAILCEGQLDVIACHRAGLTNAVAPQGTAFTPEQAKLLKRFNSKVVVAFDGDKAGRKAASRCFDELVEAGLEMSVVTLPDGEDPDGFFKKYGAEGLKNAFSQQRDFFDVGAEQINTTNFDTTTAKSMAINELLQKLAMINDGIARQLKLQQLSDSLKLGEELLLEELKKIMAANARRNHYKHVTNNAYKATTQEAPKDPVLHNETEFIPPPSEFGEIPLEEPIYDEEIYDQPVFDEPPPEVGHPPAPDFSQNNNFRKKNFYKKGGYGKWNKNYRPEPPMKLDPKSKEEKAMLELLDLGIYHGFISHYLIKELKPEYLPEGVLSDMIQEMVAYTIQGEWSHIGKILSDHYSDRLTPEIAKILTETQYPQLLQEDEKIRKRIQALANDCLITLQIHYFTKKEKEIIEQFKSAKDMDKKRELLKQQQELMQARQKAKNHLMREE